MLNFYEKGNWYQSSWGYKSWNSQNLLRALHGRQMTCSFTSALCGFILAQLILGPRQQSIRLITCVCWYVPCMFVHVSVHVYPMRWGGRPGIPTAASSKTVISNLLREQWFHRLSVAIVHTKHSHARSGGSNLQDPSAPFCYTALMQGVTLIWLLVRTG